MGVGVGGGGAQDRRQRRPRLQHRKRWQPAASSTTTGGALALCMAFRSCCSPILAMTLLALPRLCPTLAVAAAVAMPAVTPRRPAAACSSLVCWPLRRTRLRAKMRAPAVLPLAAASLISYRGTVQGHKRKSNTGHQ